MTDPNDALDQAYGDLAAFALALDEQRSWAPTRCLGWVARDLVHHVLADVRRILVALATPAQGPADVDFVSYWIGAPGAPDAASRGIRAERALASAWSLPRLTETFAETAAAVCWVARRTPPDQLVATQGHRISVGDLVATAVTEAAIHHLDLLEPPGPRPDPLAVARRTMDGLLERVTPPEWSSADWVLTASGRIPPDASTRSWLGRDVDRLPLLR